MPLTRAESIQLFLFVCVPVRLALTGLVATQPGLLPFLAIPAALVALSFLLIFAFQLRRTGTETGGRLIWWDNLRPVHAVLYAAFAYFAWSRDPRAWVPLLLDVGMGLFAFYQRQCGANLRCLD